MSEKELKDIWIGSGEGEEFKLDLTQLEIILKSKTKKMNRTLFWRDTREIIAAVAVMVIFSYKAISDALAITKFTSVLFVLWAIYVAYRLLNVRKYKGVGDLSNSFKAQLIEQKMYLQKQAILLDNVLSWYVGPFAIIFSIWIVGTSFSEEPIWVTVISIIVKLLILGLFSWWLYVLNKRAARTDFTPLIENIDNVLFQLDEDLV